MIKSNFIRKHAKISLKEVDREARHSLRLLERDTLSSGESDDGLVAHKRHTQQLPVILARNIRRDTSDEESPLPAHDISFHSSIS